MTKIATLLVGVLVGLISFLYIGIGGVLRDFIAWTGLSGLNARLIVLVAAILLPSIAAIVGGGICSVKLKIGGAVLIVAAVGHALVLGLNPLGLGFTLPLLAAGAIGLFSPERDSSGIELAIVYVGLMIGGDYIAYLIGAAVERIAPALSLTVFLAMYFLLLWATWVLAVKITQPLAAAKGPAAKPP